MVIRVTPLDHSGQMIELSRGTRIFEKQVIPFGTFGYKGSKFTIDEKWADDAIGAFNDRAFDQVVFALADENNSHSVDDRPDRFAGEVIGLKKTDKGVNAIIKPTDKATKLINDTDGKLGVSIRFREPFDREADGKTWKVAIDQVLGTTDPRITGMDPWKEITLSNVSDPADVEDSSSGEWTVTKPDNGNEDKVTLTKSEYDQLKKLIEAGPNTDDTPVEGEKDLPDILSQVEDLAKKYGVDGADDSKSDDNQPVGLSNSDRRIIELSIQVAESTFERDASVWRQNGVPPAIIELAKPLLCSYDKVRVVQLSNSGEVELDARSIVRKILDECKGMVELSTETGHAMRPPKSDTEFDALYKRAFEETTTF